MNNEIVSALDDAYVGILNDIAKLEWTEEEHDELEWRFKLLSELHKERMAEAKAFNDAYTQTEEIRLKEEAQANEVRMKEAQLREGKKDRFTKIVMDGCGIVIPVCVSSYWMAKGLKFEENGTFTSRALKWVSDHLRLFKK